MARERSQPIGTSGLNRRGFAHLALCVGAAVAASATLMLAAPGPAQKRKSKVSAKVPNDAYASQIAPLIKKYCGSCHGKAATAGLDLTLYKDTTSVLKGRSSWEKAAEYIGSGHMPPVGQAQPTKTERDSLVTWIESTLSSVDCKPNDPGRVTMRRLNREEYNNTVRDLLGVNLKPADAFPNDDVGYGFDNIGDVLSMSPLLMEKYLAAAEKITAVAISVPSWTGPSTRLNPTQFEGGELVQQGRALTKNGEITADYQFPSDGDYILKVFALSRQLNGEAAKMAVKLEGKELLNQMVSADRRQPGVYQTKTKVAAGKRKVAMAFLNEFHRPDAPSADARDRTLFIQALEIVGPLKLREQALPESHTKLITVKPTNGNDAECARTILTGFTKRAYRRPVAKEEVERLVKIVQMAEKQGESFERGIQLAVQAVLVSPNFLFRVEVDPNPNDPKASHFLNDYELASRLSYFLWSSMPDDELFLLASNGALKNPKVLDNQVRRMVRDPRAHALVDNFAGQWLQLRSLQNVDPDTQRFPQFNEQLRADMRKETELFFDYVLHQDRPILDFLDCNYTFVNDRLAKLYNINGVQGDNFRKISLADSIRGGLVTQASMLTVTSNPTRTSPVKRGKYILDQILGTPPPPPPPMVPELKDGPEAKGTLKERMEQHRKDPGCASCHGRMDPLGFGLENYNAVGVWRTKDGDLPIDPGGVLPDGTKFSGPAQLKKLLLSKKAQFTRSLTEKMMTYALGRGMEYYDKCACQGIAKKVANNNYRFVSLISEIVRSDPFLKRRGDTPMQKASR